MRDKVLNRLIIEGLTCMTDGLERDALIVRVYNEAIDDAATDVRLMIGQNIHLNRMEALLREGTLDIDDTQPNADHTADNG